MRRQKAQLPPVWNEQSYAPKRALCMETLRAHCRRKPQTRHDGTGSIWILKPGCQSRGRGIVLHRRLDEICRASSAASAHHSVATPRSANASNFIVQKYIERPLLIGGSKFDIRQWFLVQWHPLKVWIYRDSYIRFSCRLFDLDDFNEAVHLTNNAIQGRYLETKTNAYLPAHCMWTKRQLLKYLKFTGIDPRGWHEEIYARICEHLCRSVEAATSELDIKKLDHYELFGADFMLTEDLMPWLIEINAAPALSPTTEVTDALCSAVLQDSIKVLVDYPLSRSADCGGFFLAYEATAHEQSDREQSLQYDYRVMDSALVRELTSTLVLPPLPTATASDPCQQRQRSVQLPLRPTKARNAVTALQQAKGVTPRYDAKAYRPFRELQELVKQQHPGGTAPNDQTEDDSDYFSELDDDDEQVQRELLDIMLTRQPQRTLPGCFPINTLRRPSTSARTQQDSAPPSSSSPLAIIAPSIVRTTHSLEASLGLAQFCRQARQACRNVQSATATACQRQERLLPAYVLEKFVSELIEHDENHLATAVTKHPSPKSPAKVPKDKANQSATKLKPCKPIDDAKTKPTKCEPANRRINSRSNRSSGIKSSTNDQRRSIVVDKQISSRPASRKMVGKSSVGASSKKSVEIFLSETCSAADRYEEEFKVPIDRCEEECVAIDRCEEDLKVPIDRCEEECVAIDRCEEECKVPIEVCRNLSSVAQKTTSTSSSLLFQSCSSPIDVSKLSAVGSRSEEAVRSTPIDGNLRRSSNELGQSSGAPIYASPIIIGEELLNDGGEE